MGKNNIKVIIIVVGIVLITMISTGMYFYYNNRESNNENSKPEPTATPVPTATPTPSATPTPVPTATPEPTPLPVAPEKKQKKISDCTNCELSVDESIKELYNSIFPVEYDSYGVRKGIDDNGEFIYHNTKQSFVKDIPNYTKMQLMIEYICGVWSGKEYQIEEEKFKEVYHQLFGKNTEYNYEDYNNGCDYMSKKGNIIELGSGECGDNSMIQIFRHLYKAEKNNNELYMYEKTAFNFNRGLYKDYEHNELISKDFDYDELLNNIWENNTFGEYEDKASTYKYTFKPNDDGTYYFYSVELVK